MKPVINTERNLFSGGTVINRIFFFWGDTVHGAVLNVFLIGQMFKIGKKT